MDCKAPLYTGNFCFLPGVTLEQVRETLSPIIGQDVSMKLFLGPDDGKSAPRYLFNRGYLTKDEADGSFSLANFPGEKKSGRRKYLDRDISRNGIPVPRAGPEEPESIRLHHAECIPITEELMRIESLLAEIKLLRYHLRYQS
jgi:hypothetical protein